MITADEARELFDYDSDTGILYWREPGVGRRPDLVAGTVEKSGYLQVHVRPRCYRVHRLIWLIQTGRWPAGQLDHKNTNRLDNSWKNLRPATQIQQNANQRVRKDNALQIKGVYWHQECKGYAAVIFFNKRKIWLGAHKTPELASAAYAQAAKKYYGDFARAT